MKKSFLLVAAVVMMAFAVNTNAQMAVGIQGSLALPTGDVGDLYDMGFGGTGTFLYSVTPEIQVTGSVGYLMFSGKDLYDGFDFSIIPIMVGGRYNFEAGSVKPYVSAEVGLAMSSMSGEVSFYGYTYEVDESGSDFAIAPGAGIVIPVSPNVGVDVNAKYIMVMTEGTSTNIIGINAGVQVAL